VGLVTDFRPTITAHIVVRGARRAAEWYADAFGAVEENRIAVPDGRFLEIALRIGNSPLMLCDEFPEMAVLSPLSVGGTYGALHIATDEVDVLWARALAAGAEVHQPLQDAFWGERTGQVIDPFGHRWGLSQHLRDVPPSEVAAGVAAMFGAAPQD
jgi:PhnB protein